MCTIVDNDATEKFKSKIIKTGKGYAWKLVQTRGNSYWAPFQHHKYSRHGGNKNISLLRPIFDEVSNERCLDIELGEGVFHFFFSREKARKVLKWMKNPNCLYSRVDAEYKVVKVVFEDKDFVAVGQCPADWKIDWGFDGNTDAICATAFKFVD